MQSVAKHLICVVEQHRANGTSEIPRQARNDVPVEPATSNEPSASHSYAIAPRGRAGYFCWVKTTLAIIEDQPAIRQALQTYFRAQPEFDCVAVVASVEELLAALAAGGAAPRLVLSDIGLPGGLSGIEGIPLIRARVPAAEVVLLTVYQEPDRVVQALCAGAVGYLVKSTPLPDIKQALLDVLAGGSPMSPPVARHVVRYFRPVVPQAVLTAREQQVVEAIEQGLSYKLVADRLGMSLDTVRSHIRTVYRKLEVNSKAELINRVRNR